MLDDFLEQRDAVFPLIFRVIHEVSVAGGAVTEWGVELVLIGIEV